MGTPICSLILKRQVPVLRTEAMLAGEVLSMFSNVAPFLSFYLLISVLCRFRVKLTIILSSRDVHLSNSGEHFFLFYFILLFPSFVPEPHCHFFKALAFLSFLNLLISEREKT